MSKEDEAAGEEVEVRKEDQNRINKFSRLHQKETLLEESLKEKSVGPIHYLRECLGVGPGNC